MTTAGHRNSGLAVCRAGVLGLRVNVVERLCRGTFAMGGVAIDQGVGGKRMWDELPSS